MAAHYESSWITGFNANDVQRLVENHNTLPGLLDGSQGIRYAACGRIGI